MNGARSSERTPGVGSLSRDLHQEAQPVAKGQPEGPNVHQAGESPDAAFGEVP